jgi:limonene-1,2-epoxide hydrolase
MSDSPESLVRKFFAVWAIPKPDELGSFFSDTAVWVDGPQGVRRCADAIRTELAAQVAAVGGVVVELTALVSSGRIVMAEQVHRSTIRGGAITSVVMPVFELGADGRIQQWREAYGLKSATDQIEAAVHQAR